jgi:late competence protein required for DNA uptake (superfamily II DNA/RNA helicase)
VIVSSEQFLVNQLKKMLGEARQNLPVMTMQQALLSHDQFDVFIIDEADQSLLEKGISTTENLSQFAGFWNILLKRTILLTATACDQFVDILFEVFGIKSESFLTFGELLK